ncbi:MULTISPECIES: FKBP-type peptidyl-prolyl cis-trans isomerase [unclassified Microbacterium]|uniref:FKBP-type peptidyl-prolyl cis-trans isomerase n=1 Tax=unclassified Microbacterium TaxID=2609290 RepID=UPI00374569FF
MRRIPVLLAVTALVGVGLVGCSSAAPASSCDALPSDAPGVSDLIDVSGESDVRPAVTVRTPFYVSDTTAYALTPGDGARITDDSQMVALDISLFSGETGESLVSTSYDDGAIEPIALSQWSQTFPTLPTALDCAAEGSRVVVALPASAIAPEALAGLGLEEGDSAVAVVDVRRAYLPRADGADQFTDAHGLPTVVRAPDGRPGIIIPDTEAPTDPVVEELKKGDGAAVAEDSTALIHFTSVSWDDPQGTVESTWDAEPIAATLDAVPPVIADALNGATVGSQLLVVQPASDGSDGATASDTALVYVIDILGVE